MTDMHLLVPPLEDESIQGEKGPEHGMAENKKKGDSRRSVLPEELRGQFESMKTAWRQARRASNGEGVSADGDVEELRRKERETAIETALAVEAEVARWQTGIAELEALLAEGDDDVEGGESDEDIPAVRQQMPEFVRFPSLPPVVPLEDDESGLDEKPKPNNRRAKTPAS